MAEKQLIFFDLDGTLAESKSQIDDEMAGLLNKLLERKKVAIISGGAYPQFEKQLIARLAVCGARNLENLFLFPTCGTAFYNFSDGDWHCVYQERLSANEQNLIIQSFGEAFAAISYQHPLALYGDVIENRGSQITFSALGQRASVEEKQKWFDANNHKRIEIQMALARLLPDFEVRLGGLTSIDVTKKGLDKAYGVMQASKHLNMPIESIVFIGDALYEGGNDHAVIRTGTETVSVKNPEETKKIIKSILL